MCLETITESYEQPKKRARWAWKIFFRRSQQEALYFPLYNKNGGKLLWYDNPWNSIHHRVTKGEWMAAVGATVYVRRYQPEQVTYTSGFHCYPTKKEALKFMNSLLFTDSLLEPYAVLVRVRVRGIRYLGMQQGSKVIVAQEMFVPKDAMGDGDLR